MARPLLGYNGDTNLWNRIITVTMMQESSKQALDAISVFTVVGTLGEILPPLAAILTIVWTAIRIYETETVQRMLGKDDEECGP